MSDCDWIDTSLSKIEGSIDSLHLSFNDFVVKFDELVEHLKGCSFNKDSIDSGIDTLSELPEINYIDVNGREEHEALLKDPQRCRELGIDPVFETIVYLKRWHGWLESKNEEKSD